MTADTVQNVAEVLLRAIATQPDSLRIERVDEGDRTAFTVQVDPTDVGRVIGRKGRTINAIRTIVKAAGLKAQRQINLELMAPDLASVPEEA